MMDAYKLDETIKGFESEVEKLKSVNELYKRIDETYKQIVFDIELFKKNNQEILNLNNRFEGFLGNFDEFQGKIANSNQTVKESIEDALLTLKSENVELNRNIIEKTETLNQTVKESIEDGLASIKSENLELNRNIMEKIDRLNEDYDKRFFELRKENRELYQELEKLLSSKLDRTKSDIEVSIREGNVNIERIIGSQFDLKFIQFHELITNRFEQVDKKIGRQYIFSGCILALVVIDIIIKFVMV